ncbi:unnamed protein product [Auanema sp. JU1783]|nr:unnamed protein product [Auanema sp. JU1783]
MGDTNMRNEDFRKLLASTPRRNASDTPRVEHSSHTFKHPKFKPEKKKPHLKAKRDKTEEDEDNTKLKEILKNYRDRAAERRKEGPEDFALNERLTSAYRPIPLDSKDEADLRKQAIEESKYLGGDMDHTHLVKGLDYALLNKVRSEIAKSQDDEKMDDEQLEKAFIESEGPGELKFDSVLARNIHTLLFKNELPLRNELFGKGRMAYIVNMEEEDDTDIPTTLMRSIQECPKNESNANINANNMLISKLTQVLSYLRSEHKKKKNRAEITEEEKSHKDSSIFENEDEYVPKKERDRKSDKNEVNDRKKGSYFGDSDKSKDADRYKDKDRREKDREERRERERERDRERELREEEEKNRRLQEKMDKRRKEMESGGYDECYPGGLAEMGGGTWDSDEEEDLTKMDMGSKKGSLKRWDFENEDEFEKYQRGREANPKAAFQFGVKSNDGRKTRKSGDTNKKIDRELVKINEINEKRKAGGDRGDYKKPKY